MSDTRLQLHGTSPLETSTALITNDAIVFGLLMIILATIFWTSSSNNTALKRFYGVVPMLLLCYFVPSLLTTFNIVDGEHSKLYFVASRYLLPACLVLLTLSVDLREIAKLGWKPVVMFLTGTFGVIIGGPLAIFITSFFAPDLERRMVNLNHFFDYLPKRDSLFSEVNYASSFRRYPNPRCGFC